MEPSLVSDGCRGGKSSSSGRGSSFNGAVAGQRRMRRVSCSPRPKPPPSMEPSLVSDGCAKMIQQAIDDAYASMEPSLVSDGCRPHHAYAHADRESFNGAVAGQRRMPAGFTVLP